MADDEINALEQVDLLLFTHRYGNHYGSEEAVKIFEVTGTAVLAVSSVANDLKGKIYLDKLHSVWSGETYSFKAVTVNAVQGTHGCSRNLYRLKMGATTIFHAGDSGYVSVKAYPADLAFLPTGIERPFTPPPLQRVRLRWL